MKKEITIRDWQKEFEAGTFNASDFDTQVKAGWYDWFCKQTSLRNKTYKMGRFIKQVKDGGKVDLDNWYVWFKNNCPCAYPLYDDFRFADMTTGDIRFTIQIDSGYQKHKYAVYGRKPLPNGEWEDHFETPLFECDNSRDLVKWLNKKWVDYGIVVINNDDSEDRVGGTFTTADETKEYANRFDKQFYNGYRIMEMEYHFENGEKIYDDEIVVDSVDFEEDSTND